MASSRLQALWAFSEGAFKLLDPREHVGRFPQDLANLSCSWAGRDIHGLDDDTKRRFLDTELSIVSLETDDHNEVRDLFVRLQGGKPLTPQEQRGRMAGASLARSCVASPARQASRSTLDTTSSWNSCARQPMLRTRKRANSLPK